MGCSGHMRRTLPVLLVSDTEFAFPAEDLHLDKLAECGGEKIFHL